MLVSLFAYPFNFTAEVTDAEWEQLVAHGAEALFKRYVQLKAEKPGAYRFTAQDDEVNLLFHDFDDWSRFAGLERLGAEGRVDINLGDPERQELLDNWKKQLASVICPL